MGQSVLEIIISTAKRGQGGKQAAAEIKSIKEAVGELSSSLAGVNLGALTVTGAVAALGGFIKSSVTDWSDYAEQVGKAADASGISAEQMSRLMQAADDARVPVENLERAMGIALKNGFQPSIENLAELSDRILKISDPTERAAELSRIFGKSWEDIVPFLMQGGDAIRQSTAAIADNLVVTDAMVQKNREYIKAMDDLSDAWTGAKNEVGRILVPALVEVLNVMNNSNAALEENGTIWDNVLAALPTGGLIYRKLIADQYAQEQATRAQGLALLELQSAADVGASAIEMFADRAADSAANINSTLTPSIDQVRVSFRELTAEMIFNQASQGLSAEGALELARAMGLVNETTLYAQASIRQLADQFASGKITEQEYIARLSTIRNIIDGIQPKSVEVRVDTYYTNHYDETGRNTNPRAVDYQDILNRINSRAGGVRDFVVPPGYPNDSYLMRVSSGERVTVENDRMRAEGGASGQGVVIQNVHIYNDMDYRTFVERLKIDLKRSGVQMR